MLFILYLFYLIFFFSFFFLFFNDTATTEIYTLSLHDALPICAARRESPWPCSVRLASIVPMLPARTVTSTTNSSQPTMARVRWRALQVATLAASPLVAREVRMVSTLGIPVLAIDPASTPIRAGASPRSGMRWWGLDRPPTVRRGPSTGDGPRRQ